MYAVWFLTLCFSKFLFINKLYEMGKDQFFQSIPVRDQRGSCLPAAPGDGGRRVRSKIINVLSSEPQSLHLRQFATPRAFCAQPRPGSEGNAQEQLSWESPPWALPCP